MHTLKSPLSIVLIETGGITHFESETITKKSYHEVFYEAFPDAMLHRLYPLTEPRDRGSCIREQALSKFLVARDRGDLQEGCDMERYIEDPKIRLLPYENLSGRTTILFGDCISHGTTLRWSVKDLSKIGANAEQVYYLHYKGIKKWCTSRYANENDRSYRSISSKRFI